MKELIQRIVISLLNNKSLSDEGIGRPYKPDYNYTTNQSGVLMTLITIDINYEEYEEINSLVKSVKALGINVEHQEALGTSMIYFDYGRTLRYKFRISDF